MSISPASTERRVVRAVEARACCATTSARVTRASDAGVPLDAWPNVPSPNAARSDAMAASLPGLRNATDNASVASFRARSSSSLAKRGVVVTSATSASALASARSRDGHRDRRPVPARSAVELSAERLRRVRDLRRGALRGALGEERRGDVGEPREAAWVGLRAGAHHELHRDERQALALRDDHAHAVVERRDVGRGDDHRPRRSRRRGRVEGLRVRERRKRRERKCCEQRVRSHDLPFAALSCTYSIVTCFASRTYLRSTRCTSAAVTACRSTQPLLT